MTTAEKHRCSATLWRRLLKLRDRLERARPSYTPSINPYSSGMQHLMLAAADLRRGRCATARDDMHRAEAMLRRLRSRDW